MEIPDLYKINDTRATKDYKEKTFTYIKAIPVQEVCLNCHGGNVSKKVLKQIKIYMF